MKKHIVVQWLEPGVTLRWRQWQTGRGWVSSVEHGSLATLQTHCDADSQVTLLLDGRDVVEHTLTVAARERRHLAQLLPFELESALAVDVSTVHIAHRLEGDLVRAAVVDRSLLQAQLQPLEAAGLAVESVRSLADMIAPPRQDDALQIVADESGHGAELMFRSTRASAACHTDMLENILQAPGALSHTNGWRSVLIATVSEQMARELAQQVSVVMPASEVSVRQIVNCWDLIDADQSGLLDLRQGDFAAPLRWQRIWAPWRLPVSALAASLMVFVLSAVVQIQLNNSRFNQVQTQIEQAYRSAMPQGVLVDARQQLTTQLAQLRGSSQGQQLLPILANVAPHVVAGDNLQIHRLNFTRQPPALQLSVSGPSNAAILAFQDALNNTSLQAQARAISTTGSRQRAELVVSAAAP